MNSSHAMKTCVLILLVVLLCAERAQGLRCYQCLLVPLGSSCPSVTCSSSNKFCASEEAEISFGSQKVKAMSKYCLPICPTSIPEISYLNITANATISCCQEDLCNAAVPPGSSTRALAVALLFSLGSVLLQAWM